VPAGFFLRGAASGRRRSEFAARLFYNPHVEILDALSFRWTPFL